MHRFYVPPEGCRLSVVELTGAEAHHASRVLRLRRGDEVTVLDGNGQELRCSVSSVGGKIAGLEVLQRTQHRPRSARITLLQAIPKGKILEDIIEKATELGVWRIVPVITERVVMKLGTEAAAKQAKWQHVAVEALKQSGNPWLPSVAAPVQLSDLLLSPEPAGLSLVGSLHSGRRHPKVSFDEFRQRHGNPPGSVSLWIGPEGDFTPDEMRAICNAGAQPITLGELVLRVETAAICCLSIINHELTAPPS